MARAPSVLSPALGARGQPWPTPRIIADLGWAIFIFGPPRKGGRPRENTCAASGQARMRQGAFWFAATPRLQR
eukprot:13295147-Alexandrium_andersonii.AAC.1